MTHDKFCENNDLGCGEYFCDSPCICEIVANVRADEREQAAQRVIDVETVGLCHPCAYDKATFVAAARGEEEK